MTGEQRTEKMKNDQIDDNVVFVPVWTKRHQEAAVFQLRLLKIIK